MNFNGNVKILAGTFKTWQELIRTALASRTYVSVDERARVISMWQAQVSAHLKFKPAANIYIADSWKGNINGVITQSAWAAGDFTGSPGGGQLFDGGLDYELTNPVMLANRVIYAVADTVIDLDVTTL